IAGINRSLERIGRTSRLAADQVARLDRCDREQPRTKPARRIKLIGRLVYLKEGLLKNILGRRAIAKETHKKMKQLALITRDKLGEAAAIAMPVGGKQILVSSFAV